MQELQDQIINFYHLLSKENNSLALKTQWAIFFDIPVVMGGPGQAGAYASSNQVKLEGGGATLKTRENVGGTVMSPDGGAPWDNIPAVKEVVFNNLIKKYGWMYAANVNIPGDKYETQSYGEFSSGFAKGNVGKGRGAFSGLQIDFYDTQASVTDYILRPWLILMAHNGLKIQTAKSSVHILPLMKRGLRNGGNIPRKVFSFFNCYPSMVGDERLDHSGTDVITKSVTFSYDWYSVTNVAGGAFKATPRPMGNML